MATSLVLKPGQNILFHISLCLPAEVHARHAHAFELARPDVKPLGDLLSSQNRAELVARLLR
jgi:hypothetical protein